LSIALLEYFCGESFFPLKITPVSYREPSPAPGGLPMLKGKFPAALPPFPGRQPPLRGRFSVFFKNFIVM